MISRILSGFACVIVYFYLPLCPFVVTAESREAWQQPSRVMSDLGLKQGTRIADIGCGDGYFSLRLARVVGQEGSVFAADINERSLSSLKAQSERQHLTNVVIVISECTNARLPSACVDAVLICDVLHEMPEAQRLPMINSAVWALRPEGFLYLIDYRKSRDVKFDPYEKLISRDDLIRVCTEAGLTLDAEYHYLKYQVFLRFRKAGK